MKSPSQAIAFINENHLAHHFCALRRGIEKESLRVDRDGVLAQTPHPEPLGAALTHPAITTDYSEALLEFITPTHTDIEQLLGDLFNLHHFTYQHLDAEKLWVASMPCIVPGADHIPIARYGTSNIAQMKQIYRKGLHLRYGSLMQTVSGIHYNFSLPEAFWNEIHRLNAASGEAIASAQTYQSAQYFALIRNFHRHSYLPCYLFGASPAVCKSFLRGREHLLEDFDAASFYAPWATSLRLSHLGYSSDAQSGIEVDYNHVQGFVRSIRRAIAKPHPPYQKLGVQHAGAYRQLNPNLLQIENEFYAVIRPKRVSKSGESPSNALLRGGVQYVEVRSLDLNPYEPIGIDAECVRFFDMFLLHCLFTPSPPLGRDDARIARENRQRVVLCGRRPGLTLRQYQRDSASQMASDPNDEIAFTARAYAILEQMQCIAEWLDQLHGGTHYAAALHAQREKIADPARTLSARMLCDMKTNSMSFYEFAFDLAEQHERNFKHTPLDESLARKMRAQAAQSHRAREKLEQQDTQPFAQFLAAYLAQG